MARRGTNAHTNTSGEILKEELNCLELSASKLATMLNVPTNRITQLLNHKRAVTPDTARRLGAFFGTSPQFWMNLQTIYEMDLDFADPAKAREIAAIRPYRECVEQRAC